MKSAPSVLLLTFAFAIAGAAAAAADIDGNALLNLLVQKGVVTGDEAARLRTELTAKPDKPAEAAKSKVAALPDSVSGVKIGADFRARFEQNNADDSSFFTRNRYRYRMRIGATTTFVDNFDVGVRIASGNPLFNPGGTLVGGSPITANQDLNSLESRKFLWIDAAYAKWTPIKNDEAKLSATVGKMDNPFALSPMIWDADIAPEGGALQLDNKLSAQHSLRTTGAFFVLDEVNQGVGAVPSIKPTHDPYVYGGQASLESKWSSDFETSIGVAGFDISNRSSLSSKVQPYYNSGTSRDAASGVLKYKIHPVIGTASATWKMPQFPGYAGAFPIKASGEWMRNSGAPTQNKAYRLGLNLGKAGKRDAWEFNYRYQRLEADAWFDALVDDDNGAFYLTGNPQLVGTGKANGWFGGTNVKGHWFQFTYSPTDYLNLTATWYLNELIVNAPSGKSDAGHFFFDAMWKF